MGFPRIAAAAGLDKYLYEVVTSSNHIALDSNNETAYIGIDFIHYTVSSPAYLDSNNTLTFVEADSTTTYSVTVSDTIYLGSSNIVATISASTATYSATTSGNIIVGSDELVQSIEFIDITTATMFSVTQAGVSGVWLSSDNDLTSVDEGYDSFTSAHGELQLAGEMTYGLYNPVVVAFEQDGALILSGVNAAATSLESIIDAHETWIVNGRKFDVSMYSNWKFNSYASFQGTYYGVL